MVVFSPGTYDNIKALVSAGAVQMLLDGAREFEEDSETIPWIFLALKQLSANHESVNLVRTRASHFLFPAFLLWCTTRRERPRGYTLTVPVFRDIEGIAGVERKSVG